MHVATRAVRDAAAAAAFGMVGHEGQAGSKIDSLTKIAGLANATEIRSCFGTAVEQNLQHGGRSPRDTAVAAKYSTCGSQQMRASLNLMPRRHIKLHPCLTGRGS